MNNKEKVKKLMQDGRKRFIDEVSEELDISPRDVHRIFLELDKEDFWETSSDNVQIANKGEENE